MEEAAASSMAFTTYFSCVSAASNSSLSSFMHEVRCCSYLLEIRLHQREVQLSNALVW